MIDVQEAQEATAEKLEEFNTRDFRVRTGCRRSAYLEEEKAYMLPLPAIPFEPAVWSVAIDSALLRSPADGAEKKSVLTDKLVFSGNRGFLFPKTFQHGTDYMTGTSIFAFHRLSPSL